MNLLFYLIYLIYDSPCRVIRIEFWIRGDTHQELQDPFMKDMCPKKYMYAPHTPSSPLA